MRRWRPPGITWVARIKPSAGMRRVVEIKILWRTEVPQVMPHDIAGTVQQGMA